MKTVASLPSVLKTGATTTETALELFDSLEPVDLDFMLGRWQGSGLHTNHPMDGFLEASNWYGKEFVDEETVHPLLISRKEGQTFKIKARI